MKKILLIYFLCRVGMFSLSAQIVTDSILTKYALVNNSEVQALLTTKDITYKTIEKSNQWQPFDSTFITSPKHILWLRFTIGNRTKQISKIYLYARDHEVDITLINNIDTTYLKNGYLVPLAARTNKRESFFNDMSIAPMQNALCVVKISNDYVSSKPN